MAAPAGEPFVHREAGYVIARIAYLGVLLIMVSNAAGAGVSIKAEAAPEYDALFTRTSGWIGADGDYSVALDKNTVLWLFSDTFVGKVTDGKRVDTVMINNSAAIQHIGSKKPTEFFYRAAQDGKPASFATPNDGRGYFWLFGAAMTSKGLYMFLTRVEHSDASPVFPFKLFGMSLGHVEKPTGSPLEWKITQSTVPFARFASGESVFFGSAVMTVGPDAYIYGVDSRTRAGAGNRTSAMIVARVPEDKLGEFDAWRFYSGGKWTTDWEKCDPLFEGIATEFSVSYIPGIKQYAAVYTEGGIYGNILVRLAPKPEGPWGEPVKVFDCPDKRWHEKTYSYAAKAHPELSKSPNELIVTYATNSMHFPDLFDDARIYWPRFVRLTVTSYK